MMHFDHAHESWGPNRVIAQQHFTHTSRSALVPIGQLFRELMECVAISHPARSRRT